MSDKEFNELVFYVSGMKQQLNTQERIIQMQNNRIEEQGRVIDELAWQLRDLRAAVREVREYQVRNAKTRIYENAEGVCLRKQTVSSGNRKCSMRPGSSSRFSVDSLNEGDGIYEPINFPRRDYTAQSDSLCNRLSVLSSVAEQPADEEDTTLDRASSLETLFRTFQVGSTKGSPIDTGGRETK
ncbi:uncharacterized protein LOC129790743 [Lutzomyia longipalpis]|uniref:uncharacterized protein LOC129790743 n=1 Tax=Lutzomyia longipalpis TaxID=7200 RepID=UPI0024834E18|nr:uncharacterized protein LOC129790743 [Lutzomyia longipalpis]